jgi:hypothetical protein
LGADALVSLLNLPDDPPPALETALRGCVGFLDAMTVHWLTHNPQLEIGQLVDMVYDVVLAAVVSALGSRDALSVLKPIATHLGI